VSSLDNDVPIAGGESDEGAATETSWLTRLAHRLMISFFFAGSRLLNPLIKRVAGGRLVPMLAIVAHEGRRSGRAYATPVGARPTPDGFIVPLTFGAQADWYQNTRAAGKCVIRWKGADYVEVDPQIVNWTSARAAFYPLERVVIPAMGLREFVRLRHATR
jgi:deazaflavin-dependent oxidoreductase (nitroreductase family)